MVLALFYCSSAVAAVPGDWDGYGESDPAAAQRTSGGFTRFTVRLTETGQLFNFDFLGLADAMILQRFGNMSRPGIVRVLGLNQPLQWQIAQPNTTIRTFYFGMPGDIVPNHYGADFDGDGTSDCYVVRNVNNALWWFITPNCDPENNGFYSFAWGVASSDRPLVGDLQSNGIASAIAVRKFGPNLQWWARNKQGQAANYIFGDKDDIPLIPQNFSGGNQAELAIARKTGEGMQIWIRKSDGSYISKSLGSNDGIPFTGRSNGLGTGVYGTYIRSAGFGAIANIYGSHGFFNPLGGNDHWFVAPDGTIYPTGQGPTSIGGGSGGDSGGGDGGGESGDWCGGSATVDGTTYSSSACTVKLKLPDGSGKNKSNSANSKGVIKMMIDGRYTDDMVTNSSGKATWYLCSEGGSQLDTLREATPREYGNRRRCYGSKSLGSLNSQRNMTVVAPKRGGGAFCAKLPSNRTID